MRRKRRLHRWLVRCALIAVTILVVFPFFWILVGSLEPLRNVLSNPPHFLPIPPRWSNYPRAWAAAPFGTYYRNSIIVTTAIVAGQVVTCSMGAYALTFLRLRMRTLLFFLVIIGLMVPEQVSIVPVFLEMHDLGWINTYAALIVPFLGSAFGIFLLRQSFISIPPALVEAARMDGASHWRTLTRVVIPNARPALITLVILNAVFHYNDLFWPLMFTNTNSVRTLPVGLALFFASQGDLTPWNLLMASDVFIVVPLFILFFVGQRYLVQGVATTGIK